MMDWTGPDSAAVANALLEKRPGDDIPDLVQHIHQLKQVIRSKDGTETGLTGFDLEFAFIEKRCSDPDRRKTFLAAERRENGPKNRYINVLPPDDTRVELTPLSGIQGSDYVNANHILSEGDHCPKYIATQGPVSNTVNDFWRMVWEQNSRVIVMLTKEVESGRTKCVKYWPETETVVYDNIRVQPIDVDDTAPELVIRTFEMTHMSNNESESRLFTHLQYKEWPDHGLPSSTRGFLQLVQLVRQLDNGSPIIVHCSAGIGRSGTFCTVHSNICMMDAFVAEHKKLPMMNIVRTVLNFRDQRPGMVQNKEQYMFCYLSILQEYIKLRDALLAESKRAK